MTVLDPFVAVGRFVVLRFLSDRYHMVLIVEAVVVYWGGWGWGRIPRLVSAAGSVAHWVSSIPSRGLEHILYLYIYF